MEYERHDFDEPDTPISDFIVKLIFFFGNVFVGLVISSCLLAQPLVASRAIVDLSAFCTNPNLAVEEGSEGLVVTWKISDVESGRMVFNLDGGHPLIESLGIAGTGREPQVILKRIDPVVLLTVGERDLTNPAGWVAFSTTRRFGLIARSPSQFRNTSFGSQARARERS